MLAIHEFHVWQLAGNRIIASAHIRCQNLRDYMVVAERVKTFFHNEGIHSTTIQPEFIEVSANTCYIWQLFVAARPHWRRLKTTGVQPKTTRGPPANCKVMKKVRGEHGSKPLFGKPPAHEQSHSALHFAIYM